MPATLDLAIQQISAGLGGVSVMLSRPGGPSQMLALLGWDTPPGMNDIGLSGINLSDLLDKVEQLDLAISVGTSGLQLDADYASVAVALGSFLQGIDNIVNGFTATGDYLAKTNLIAQFVPRLLDYVVVEAVQANSMATLAVSTFAGIIEFQPYDADPTIYQVAHVRRVVHWDRIPRVFSDIRGLLKDVYGWGAANFDATPLTVVLGAILHGLSAQTAVRALPRRAEFALVGHDVPDADINPMTQLLLSIYRSLGAVRIDSGLSITAMRPTTAGGTDAGLAIAPYLHGTTDLQYPISDTVTFGIDSSLDATAGVALILRAGTPPLLKNNLTAGGIADVASGHLLASLTYAAAAGATTPVLTITDGIGLEASSLTLSAGADVDGGQIQAMFKAELKGGHFKLDTSKMDSFIASVIPLSLDVAFDFGAGWSEVHGFFFEGSASPRVTLDLHLTLGPFAIENLLVGLDLGQGNTLPTELSVTGGVDLGPIAATVDRLGMTAAVAFQRGNLGPANLSISLKPPNGLGLALDAGVIAGGGYVFFDPSKGEYAGVLDAALLDTVEIKIIAVLDTIMPDDSNGFAFLLIITFDLPPIQLSFGFTLNGVGGLVGINRTSSQDALHAGFRAHSLDSVLFPPDPVANAPAIISNIRNFFPAAQNRFLIGPMVEIGWGTPTLITLAVGVFVEVPDPIRIIILGLIDAGLPTADEALIELHIDVLGIVDFGAKMLSIDGSLFDSRVLAFSVQGDLALRLSWGSDPNFVFSLGGFNPHFNTAGLDVPAMQRCSVSIGDGDNPRISANNYFAITSNSVQFGANVEAYAAAGGFSIHGYLGFDLIVIISPFSFEFDFSAGFDVSFEGTSLLGLTVNGSFFGPRPWHLHGDAEIHILFFSVGASVDLTWGDSTPAVIPSKPVLPDLLPALQDPRNWSAALPDGTTQAASFAAPAPSDQTVLVHPMGTLSVRERVVPLDLDITRYGDATPSDGTRFSISDVQINNQHETSRTISDYFAAGQFLTLSDADKLSRPSFERYDTGVTVGSAAILAGADSPRTVTYEERYIDVPTNFSRFTRLYAMPANIHGALVAQGAGYLSPLKNTGMTKYRDGPATPAVTTQDPAYVVAGVDDLAIRSDVVTAAGVTYFQARASLNSYLTAHPEEAANLQILPAHEAAA
jgi:hypothetical protein